MAEKEKKAEVGDVRPVYQQVGWEVCKEAADKPEKEVFTPTETIADAEILSFAYKEKEKSKEKKE